MQDTTKQTPYGTPTDTSPDDEQKHDMPETGTTEKPYSWQQPQGHSDGGQEPEKEKEESGTDK